jgi:hypothetical protein
VSERIYGLDGIVVVAVGYRVGGRAGMVEMAQVTVTPPLGIVVKIVVKMVEVKGKE